MAAYSGEAHGNYSLAVNLHNPPRYDKNPPRYDKNPPRLDENPPRFC